ncbi:MAG: hypothetical protein ACLUR9_03185 [Christensenellales bacterium]
MKRSKHFAMVLVAMVLVGCICAQFIGIGGALAAADEKGEYICALSGEQIITSPQQVDGYVTRVSGVMDVKEDGFAVYYSTQDYEYETKENAIWFPEREDYPLKKFLEDNPAIKQGKILDNWDSLYCVINGQKQNGYAATATYLNQDWELLKKDDVYKQAKKDHLKPGKRYDREEEKKEAVEVSYYRLQGNPEQYDGKKIKVEVIFIAPSELDASANQETAKFGGMWEVGYVNDESTGDRYKETWDNLTEKYKQYGETVMAEIWGIITSDEKMHVNLTCMYYMYRRVLKDDIYFIGYGGTAMSYTLMGIEIHEKDRGKLIQLLEEFEKERNK